ncbi:VOC family protein [Chitinophaga nivalis]|uniref:VOC family protein n=1 Tax=Chitinophaga nivalis TaxID=2991709 RepID=A0ABT3IHA0_9BACT|nr:VOC family protein [Chitinophaga nivalis]MCW3466975.1 VOC family protein [Chitinophaga nivalis]MCW3483334.1 VOC family protein [Chitinophaga nivalis]
MVTLKRTLLIFALGLLSQMISSCKNKLKNEEQAVNKTMVKKHNPVVYFEIPVDDMDRAITFYKAVFDFDFSKTIIDHNEMALFPFSDEHSGISGALAKGEIYKPTKNGVVIYFNTENIDAVLKRVLANGGQILYPKTSNGELGFVAELEDSEGNRIALHEAVK